MAQKSLSERFNEKWLGEPNSGCWLWMARVNHCGYGTIGNNLAHRVSYELFKGEIPAGLSVMHSCDVRCCVNPDHLSAGTHQENIRQRGERGGHHRVGFGEKNSGAKLTEDQVRDIRKREMSNLEYATKYGITHGSVNKIWRRHTWRHVR